MAPPKDPLSEIKGWQQALQQRMHYLPWEQDASWFRCSDPQEAWAKCNDPCAVLWMLGKSLDLHDWTAYRELAACLYHVAKVHSPSHDVLEIDVLDAALSDLQDKRHLWYYAGYTHCKTAAYRVNRLFPDDNIFEIEHGDATYFYARCLSDIFTVYAGVATRLHHVGYYLGKLGAEPLMLCGVLRTRFSVERFTR